MTHTTTAAKVLCSAALALALALWPATADAQTAKRIMTVAGGGGSTGEGVPATSAALAAPAGIAIDSSGNLYISEFGHDRVRKVDAASGLITTVAGTGVAGYSGDDGPATQAQLAGPRGIAVDAAGNLYIADTANHRVRKVSATTGIITTVAGTGVAGSKGDGGAATLAQLNAPSDVAVDSGGEIYIADSQNNRIRKTSRGNLITVAGAGVEGFAGDGGPAVDALLDTPASVSVDGAFNIYISDTGNQRIRRVSSLSDRIGTVAGNGTQGFSGDGGPTTQAMLFNPIGVCVDGSGGFFIADQTNHRIRRVARSIWTAAGDGDGGFDGDGGPALGASLFYPQDVAVDGAGNLYIADSANNRIRKLEPVISTRGDFGGDAKADILWHHDSRGEVWLWPMDGASRTGELYVRSVVEAGWGIRATADVTGDGKADVLWRHVPSGMLYLWAMDGPAILDEAYVATVDPHYDIACTGDYNGDGYADLAWRHATSGEVWIWLMKGATPLAATYVDTVDPAYSIKQAGDFDGDGKADILWQHNTLGDVWLWLMSGTSRISQSWVGTVPELEYRIAAVSDFSGDGKSDIVWHHVTRGEVWIWTMDGDTKLAETYVETVPDTAYRIAGANDYDGDGKGDLLWHHMTQGDVWIWTMDGATRLAQAYVATVPDVEYRIVR